MADETNQQLMDNARLNITISDYDLRKLRNWAKCHGKTPTAYAAQIVSARIEANLDLIDRMMEDIAAYEGKTVEELEREWDDEGGE